MIRLGRYKLNYYDGLPPQLFDLEEDPFEQVDLAASVNHAAVRDALTARLLSGWDPAAIARIMASRDRDKALIGAWGRSAPAAQ